MRLSTNAATKAATMAAMGRQRACETGFAAAGLAERANGFSYTASGGRSECGRRTSINASWRSIAQQPGSFAHLGIPSAESFQASLTGQAWGEIRLGRAYPAQPPLCHA